MALVEVADWATRPMAADRVDDQHTGDLAGLAIATAITASTVSVLRDTAEPLPRNRLYPLGIALVWAGLGVNRWARTTLGRHYRPVVTVVPDHDVVATGPYRFVRHPMYLGGMVISAGFALATGSPVASAAWLFPPLAMIRRIVVEEAVLAEALGNANEAFAKPRARLIPGVW
jgi:protein-S-isoprenylcysteine O-methyltransferase Ste14